MFAKKNKTLIFQAKRNVKQRKGWSFFAYDQWYCGKIIQKGTIKFEI